MRAFPDLNPVWDQIVYIPGKYSFAIIQFLLNVVYIYSSFIKGGMTFLDSIFLDMCLTANSPPQNLIFECMDYQHLTKVQHLTRNASKYRTNPSSLGSFIGYSRTPRF